MACANWLVNHIKELNSIYRNEIYCRIIMPGCWAGPPFDHDERHDGQRFHVIWLSPMMRAPDRGTEGEDGVTTMTRDSPTHVRLISPKEVRR
jgi:hypothetical protein